MTLMRLLAALRVPLFLFALVLSAFHAPGAFAQISPNEIRDPDLKELEKLYFPQLKSINQAIAKAKFPFPFYVSRYVGIEPAKQAETDSRGLEFVKFRDRTVLKTTGNYEAAYSATQFTRNERAAHTVHDVILPILQIVTQTVPPDIACDAIGFEVSYHTRTDEKSYDYEGKEILVLVFDRKDAFLLAQETNDTARQQILDRSLIFLGGKEYGLSLLEKDPVIVDTLARSKDNRANSGSLGSSSRVDPRLFPPPNGVSTLGLADSASTGVPKVDLSHAKPAATQADVDRLQRQYKDQIAALSANGQIKFQFVDYDRPAFVLIGKQLAFQMTLKNPLHFDPEKSSLYKRAAQTFDLFLAPKMKDILELAPDDPALDTYDFAVVNTLSAGTKDRSEAMEFIFPKELARQFANSDITNQALIDKSQVLVNGVRIALNLQLVE
jgi:hypothetical protein